jgi:hypothetical protein
LAQAPNLHHIYPQGFLRNVVNLPKDAPIDSLMNICFLRAGTNIAIRDKNPLHYFNGYKLVQDFDRILDSHLIPQSFVDRPSFEPEDYCQFLQVRANLFAETVQRKLSDVDVRIVS